MNQLVKRLLNIYNEMGKGRNMVNHRLAIKKAADRIEQLEEKIERLEQIIFTIKN